MVVATALGAVLVALGGIGAAARPARAEVIALPLAGLAPELPGTGWTVASEWRPSPDPEVGGVGEDVLVRAVEGVAVARYAISAGGRTARPCPLEHPLAVDLDGVTWVHDPRARMLCRLERDARLEVRIELGDPTPEAQREVLHALAEALSKRSIAPEAVPPLHDPRVHVAADPGLGLAPTMSLPTVGVEVARPDDGYLWRVAARDEDRHYDALVRVFPTFPEVQLLVYRHDVRDLADCGALVRRQVARGPWEETPHGGPPRADPPDLMRRTIGRFGVAARCARTAHGLLDARVAVAPREALDRELAATAPLFAALVEAARRAPLPADLPPTVPARDFLYGTASLALGVALSEVRPTRPLAELDLGLAYARRNGVFLRATAHLGGTSERAIVGFTADVGVALALDPGVTFVLALDLRDERDPLLENRSLSLAAELWSGHHRDRAVPWALRVVAFQLASREPAITGAPFMVSLDLALGQLALGVDLRWVDRPLAPSPSWPGSGLVLGLRVGLGALRR